MEHSFNIYIAKQYGVNAAVLLKNIYFWIEKNRANESNFNDGHYWTYNSKKAFAELFPYMTARQVDYALQKLIDEGIIITGNYNKVAYDRTLWYAITKKGYSILQNCLMEETKTENGNTEIEQPIPDIKPVTKPTDNKPAIKDIIEYLNAKAETNYKPTTAKTVECINARLKEGFTFEDFKTVIDKKTAEWKGGEFEQYLRPTTLFGTKFEGYLNAKVNKPKAQQSSSIMDDYRRLQEQIDNGGLFGGNIN